MIKMKVLSLNSSRNQQNPYFNGQIWLLFSQIIPFRYLPRLVFDHDFRSKGPAYHNTYSIYEKYMLLGCSAF